MYQEGRQLQDLRQQIRIPFRDASIRRVEESMLNFGEEYRPNVAIFRHLPVDAQAEDPLP